MLKYKPYFRLTLESFEDLIPAIQQAFAQVKALDPALAQRFIDSHKLKMKGKELDLSKEKTITKAIYFEELHDLLAFKLKQTDKRKLSGVIQ